jgi:hypothetical protein
MAEGLKTMAKRSHSCCGRKFRNESALNQHARDLHPGRLAKSEKPARKGTWRVVFASFLGSALGVLVVGSAMILGAPVIQEKATQVVKAVHVVRR